MPVLKRSALFYESNNSLNKHPVFCEWLVDKVNNYGLLRFPAPPMFSSGIFK